MNAVDRNDMAFWFPKIKEAGLPVPRTEIVQTEVELMSLLDGEKPEGFDAFIHTLRRAGEEVRHIGGYTFLRTGHGSGKHEWLRTCCVGSWRTEGVLESHVGALVEWSASAGIFGLPTRTWAAREMLKTPRICRCEGYGMMPVVREFRVFMRDDEWEHTQPYWPPDAVEQGRPDAPEWRSRLAEISRLADDEAERLAFLAGMAVGALDGGYWSVDFLQDRVGDWWLTDMAVGGDSFRWEPDQ